MAPAMSISAAGSRGISVPLAVLCGAAAASLVAWALRPRRVRPGRRPLGVWRGPVLRSADHADAFLLTPEEGATSVWEALEAVCARQPSRPAVGQRPVLARREAEGPGGRPQEKLTLGPYRWLTNGEFAAAAAAAGAGLVTLTGLMPGDAVVIYSETQRDWLVAALGALRQGLRVVTVYATLGESALQVACAQTKARALVVDPPRLDAVVRAAGECPGLRHVVVLADGVDDQHREALARRQVLAQSFAATVASGEVAPRAAAVVDPSDVAVVMYTSGTTGVPKGVQITHANFLAVTAGVRANLASFVNEKDVYLGYLPLAHIMEMTTEIAILSFGGCVGYGSPQTLTASGTRLDAGVPSDCEVLRPTLLVFAPAVLDRVRAGVRAKAAAAGALPRALFGLAMRWGLAAYDKGGVGAGPLLDMVVFRGARRLLGGRLRACVSASAPLAPECQRFVQTCLGCPVRQGYGLTECCGAAVLADLSDNRPGTVGAPLGSACITLRDWPEGGYCQGDEEDPAVGMRRGEVLVGGPIVTAGYLVDPEAPDPEVAAKNEADFMLIDETRYFCTGDIGQVTADGCLQIVDRKKDLVKLQMGEYVALSKVENALKDCPLVELPCVHADPLQSYCVALVCPQAAALRRVAAEVEGGPGPEADWETLCADPALVEAVLRACQEACKAAGLARFEVPKRVALVADPWTPENGMLTAAMKLKRNQIVAKHKKQLDTLYT